MEGGVRVGSAPPQHPGGSGDGAAVRNGGGEKQKGSEWWGGGKPPKPHNLHPKPIHGDKITPLQASPGASRAGEAAEGLGLLEAGPARPRAYLFIRGAPNNNLHI